MKCGASVAVQKYELEPAKTDRRATSSRKSARSGNRKRSANFETRKKNATTSFLLLRPLTSRWPPSTSAQLTQDFLCQLRHSSIFFFPPPFLFVRNAVESGTASSESWSFGFSVRAAGAGAGEATRGQGTGWGAEGGGGRPNMCDRAIERGGGEGQRIAECI